VEPRNWIAAAEYLAALPPDRRDEISAVRQVILDSLQPGYQEVADLARGIFFSVPLERFGKTYNREPLALAALAARKTYNSLFVMPMFWDPSLGEWFREEFRKTGKALDMGKGSIRFQLAADLPLDLVARVVGLIGVDRYVEAYQAIHARQGRRPARDAQGRM